ncbi:Cytochrome c oxidase subunit 2 [archaeon HR06]|nr:Cytochrome c oxidase subunit 2 [archaeon HR06]
MAPLLLIYPLNGIKVIDVKASQFKFEPERIVVNRGDTIILKVKSLDVTHGFYIDGYNVNKMVSLGEEVSITLYADKLGKFKIRCSVPCGSLHPFMVGELIVEENGLNLVFLSSYFLLILLGTLVLLKEVRK